MITESIAEAKALLKILLFAGGQLQLLLLQCALNTEQSITVLAESEKYLTLELLTAKLLTLDRTKFVIYQQEDVNIHI